MTRLSFYFVCLAVALSLTYASNNRYPIDEFAELGISDNTNYNRISEQTRRISRPTNPLRKCQAENRKLVEQHRALKTIDLNNKNLIELLETVLRAESESPNDTNFNRAPFVSNINLIRGYIEYAFSKKAIDHCRIVASKYQNKDCLETLKEYLDNILSKFGSNLSTDVFNQALSLISMINFMIQNSNNEIQQGMQIQYWWIALAFCSR